MDSALFGPNAPYSQQQVMTGVPNQSLAGMYQANYNALTPEQQAWYTPIKQRYWDIMNASSAAGASYTAPYWGAGRASASV